MATVAGWIAVAKEALDAAEPLERLGFFRSAVSRAYYSAHASAHALLLHLGRVPAPGTPPRSNWTHRRLPDELYAALSDSGLREWSRRALRNDLVRAYAARVQADYKPAIEIDPREAARSLRSAHSMLRVARDLTE